MIYRTCFPILNSEVKRVFVLCSFSLQRLRFKIFFKTNWNFFLTARSAGSCWENILQETVWRRCGGGDSIVIGGRIIKLLIVWLPVLRGVPGGLWCCAPKCSILPGGRTRIQEEPTPTQSCEVLVPGTNIPGPANYQYNCSSQRDAPVWAMHDIPAGSQDVWSGETQARIRQRVGSHWPRECWWTRARNQPLLAISFKWPPDSLWHIRLLA